VDFLAFRFFLQICLFVCLLAAMKLMIFLFSFLFHLERKSINKAKFVGLLVERGHADGCRAGRTGTALNYFFFGIFQNFWEQIFSL
jgi:hypothetical protein